MKNYILNLNKDEYDVLTDILNNYQLVVKLFAHNETYSQLINKINNLDSESAANSMREFMEKRRQAAQDAYNNYNFNYQVEPGNWEHSLSDRFIRELYANNIGNREWFEVIFKPNTTEVKSMAIIH